MMEKKTHAVDEESKMKTKSSEACPEDERDQESDSISNSSDKGNESDVESMDDDNPPEDVNRNCLSSQLTDSESETVISANRRNSVIRDTVSKTVTTIPVSVITRTVSSSVHATHSSRLDIKNRMKPVNGSYHSLPLYTNNNSDEPLDLSKKSKPKTKTPPSRITTNGLSSGLSSSLQSLQQRFGGDFHINGHVRGKKSIEEKLLRNHVTSSSFVTTPSRDNYSGINTDTALKANSANPLISRVIKPGHEPIIDGNSNRYTTHRCSCQKMFSTLYELSLHLQETRHVPSANKETNLMEYPKLVRGQDMWLNQESEQTRRILRCMQCGESFKTLPELTVHMMQTQHYTKIVSSDHGRRSHKCSAYCDRDLEKECIFKCKVCQETFTDMEGLANHMILSGHHKKQILRSYNSPEILLRARRKRPFSSEEKVGIGNNPTVATLLEFKRKCISHDGLNSPNLKFSDMIKDEGYITCENCNKRIEMRGFVEHVRTCIRQRSDVIDALKLKLSNEEDHRKFPVSAVKDDKQKNVGMSDERDDNVDVLKSSFSSPGTSDEESDEPMHQETTDCLKGSKSPEKMGEEKKEKTLDIIDPNSNEVTCDSALRAMESFIKKSFSNKFSKVCHKDSYTSGSELKQRESPRSPDARSQGAESSCIQNVPSSQTVLRKASKEEVISEDPDSSDSMETAGKELQSLSDMCEQITKQVKSNVIIEEKLVKVKTDDDSPKSPESSNEKNALKEHLEEKYLHLPENGGVENTHSSALDSLSSFVYGQPMTCEHPLDSLQKLITKTDSLKMPNGTAVRCQPSPEIAIPLNLSIKSQKDEDEKVDGTFVHRNSVESEFSPPTSDTDCSADYKCPACSRQFASKGSYRYHLSRCHLSSVKKFSIRDPFTLSPFVYLPLDHTAKFTKYYEMAHELANKGAVSHELTAKGK